MKILYLVMLNPNQLCTLQQRTDPRICNRKMKEIKCSMYSIPIKVLDFGDDYLQLHWDVYLDAVLLTKIVYNCRYG